MIYFLKCFQHYADFSGRASRSEYWYFVLFYVLIAFVAAVVHIMLYLFDIANSDSFNRSDGSLFTSIFFLWVMLCMLPAWAVTVRRLHDIGESGWMILVGLIPLIGGIWLLALMCQPGQLKANRWGEATSSASPPLTDRQRWLGIAVTYIVGVVYSRIAGAISLFMYAKKFDHSLLQFFNWLYFTQVALFALFLVFLYPVKDSEAQRKRHFVAWITLGVITAWDLVTYIIALFQSFVTHPFVVLYGCIILMCLAILFFVAVMLSNARKLMKAAGGIMAMSVIVYIWATIVLNYTSGTFPIFGLIINVAQIMLGLYYFRRLNDPEVSILQYRGTGIWD